TTPHFNFGAMSSASDKVSDQTEAARPYAVLLASSTASAGVRKVVDTSTGPKISTCETVEAGCTLVSSVGGKKQPLSGNAMLGWCSCAPSRVPASTSSRMRFSCTG